jgi:hypothetical protein
VAAGACPASETGWSSRGSGSGGDLEDLGGGRGGSKVLGRLERQVKPGTGPGGAYALGGHVGYVSEKGSF